MNTQIQYEYADGSGNTFLLSSSTLEYLPVTPERSSSGTYSGGEAKKVSVTESESEQLVAMFEKAISNTSAHQKVREMMTGLIVKGNTKVVLKRSSPEKTEIEKVLKEILMK